MSRLCKTIDVKVQVFLDRVKDEGNYIWIDATDTNVRGAVGSFLSQPSIGAHQKPLAKAEFGRFGLLPGKKCWHPVGQR
ncbi:hypothetical protein ATO67_07520 [Agrobacterium bohemicum]|uniref:Uncharacterized protein n=2 Tax=Agrobacterium bohemicum TaxID=2052828 RepID=A0A135P1V8_9HYPH|nr:hypothetical protein ATO67_07520 [Agrobacterium bohemicum]